MGRSGRSRNGRRTADINGSGRSAAGAIFAFYARAWWRAAVGFALAIPARLLIHVCPKIIFVMDIREQTKAALKKSRNPNGISLAFDVDITQRQGRLPSHMLDMFNMNSAD